MLTMEPTKSQEPPKNSQRWSGQDLELQSYPSIQYREDPQDLEDCQGKRTPTPLTDGPYDDEHSDIVNTDSKDTVEDHGEAGEKTASKYYGFTIEEIGIALLMGGVMFSIQAFLSLIGPFFAVRAATKGVSTSEVGLMFGIVPLFSLILSPLFGTYIAHFGVKFLLVSGVMTVGSCSILFGFVDWIQDRAAYVALCLCVRAVEGAGTAAGFTSVYSLLTYTFPDRLATMSAYIEAMAAGGFVMGPPIGGILYQVGGFEMPFFLCGSCLLLVGLIIWVKTPSPKVLLTAKSVKHQSCWRLLLRPTVVLLLLNAVGGIASITFFLSLSGKFVTTQFLFSPVQVSLVYLCIGAGYVVGTLIWSGIIKRWPKAGAVTFSGAYIMTGIMLMFIGLTPFMQYPSDIGLFFVCTFLALMGLSSGLIPCYILGAEAKEFDGSSLDSSGWVGGVLSASFSLGSFLGPILTGIMYDTLGFSTTSTAVGSLLLVLALAQLVNHFLSQRQLYTKPQEEEKVPFAQSAEENNAKYTE